MTELRDFLEHREDDLMRALAELNVQIVTVEAELAEVRRAKAAASGIVANVSTVCGSAHAGLTMKQLVVKALREHFPHGATTREIINFSRDGWGRPLDRANLSPQISRLCQAGVIRRSGRAWVLTEKIS